MPVEFVPDLNDDDEPEIQESPRAAEALREAAAVAMKCAAIWTIVAAAALTVMIYFMQSAIQASQEVFTHHSGDWFNGIMPAVLFAIFGLLFGGLVGWRMTGSAGLAGCSIR